MEYNFDDDLDLALNTVLLRHSEFNHSFYRLWTWKVHLQILIAFIEPSAATQVKKRSSEFIYKKCPRRPELLGVEKS